jgi:predicted GIY-YIG superfamily endonuclease
LVYQRGVPPVSRQQTQMSEMNLCTIYMAVHRPSGRKYVGVTTNLKRRCLSHITQVGQSPIAKTIKSDGKDNFDWAILCERVLPKDAGALEKHYIAEHRAHDKRYGFNKSSGGVSGEVLERATEILIGIRLTPDEHSALARAAQKDDRSKAAMGRKFIVDALRKAGWLKPQKARAG